MLKTLLITYILSNNLTGLYSVYKTNQLDLSTNGINSIKYKKFGLETNHKFLLRYIDNNIAENSLSTKENISYCRSFITHQYNNSYMRGLLSDNLVGIGYGIKYVSYAILYESKNLKEIKTSAVRHSVRLKYSFKKLIVVEYYIQPKFNDFKNLNMSGSIQLNYNYLVFQVTHNYQSTETIKNIFNSTIGIKYVISSNTR